MGRLSEGAPFVAEGKGQNVVVKAERPRCPITHDLHGPQMTKQRKKTRDNLEHGKPKTYHALKRNGLALNEVRERAGVGKETVRRAIYGGGVSPRSARAIAAVLGKGLSEDEARAP
jgi:hypothetical protein